MAEKYNILQNAMSSAERLYQILDSDERPPEPASGYDPASLHEQEPIHRIDFHDVTFAYVPDKHVLNQVNLHIDSGETVAIVGPTGSGKTSLIHLLPRFYDPVTGNVSINGKDIRDIPLENLRNRIALVMQDPFLFSDTIRENIFPKGSEPESDQVWKILESANCADFIRVMPEGLDTVLSEAGGSISSGQRQLISIARALARDPDIIILDEATSYVDSETEMMIQEALSNLTRRRTTIVVAHRLSTARQADRIVLLHRGRVVETGTHDQLMDQGGLYSRLFYFEDSLHQGNGQHSRADAS
jgi:ATP-binding cassette subfamily B protein